MLIDTYGSFHFSCDVCSHTQMSESASHFGWCSSQMMRALLPANYLAEGSIISFSVNHSSCGRQCRMSVCGGEADTRWLCVQIWHIPPCSLASWWVHLVGKASGRQRERTRVCYLHARRYAAETMAAFEADQSNEQMLKVKLPVAMLHAKGSRLLIFVYQG